MKARLISLILTFILLASIIPVYADYTDVSLGNFFADALMYEARKNGIADIDVTIVMSPLANDGTALKDMSDEDLISSCSGDSLICAYVTGSELKHIAEFDVSLGQKTETCISYSGMRCKYNSFRIKYDKLIELRLYDEFGITDEREIEKDELYKLCCSLETAKQLGLFGKQSLGFLSVELKNADGSFASNLENLIVSDQNGKAISDSVAVSDYISFLEYGIPDVYDEAQGRKKDTKAPDIESRLEHPGKSSCIFIGSIVLAIIIAYLAIKFAVRHAAVKKSRLMKQS